MKIIILNFILSTAVDGRIIRRPSNRDTMIYNMARGFIRAGHQVTLLASEEFKPLEPEKNDFEVKYFPSRLTRVFKPSLLPWPIGLGRYLRNHSGDFDMVLSIETFSMPSLIASRICPEKMLIWQEMGKYQKFMFTVPARIWCHLIARTFMRRIPAVAMSPQAHGFIGKFMDNLSDVIVAHGADDRVFKPSDEEGDYFIVVAMLIKRKRIDTIIRRFADFVRSNPSTATRLKIVGEGPEKEALVSLTESLGISRLTDFMGFMNHHESAPLQARAIALLVNTESDLNMVSVTEAIADGTPVLMNSVASTADFVRSLGLGIVKDGWGAPELKEMIERRKIFHANCISNRDRFTNTGVASRLCDIFNNRTGIKGA